MQLAIVTRLVTNNLLTVQDAKSGSSEIVPPKTETLADTFETYSLDVGLYSKTWFAKQVEPQQSFLKNRPKLKRELMKRATTGRSVFTEDVYAHTGTWHDERQLEHEKLLMPTRAEVEAITLESDCVYFLLGLPGSGKSTSLRPIVYRHSGLMPSDVLASDADELRARFPEYKAGLGSGIVQNECSSLMYSHSQPQHGLTGGIQGFLLSSGRCVIVDVIGDAQYLPGLVESLTIKGRRVYVLQADCPLDVCLDRVRTRALSSGRYVPLDVVRSKVGFPERALEAAIEGGQLSGWAVIDTSKSPSIVKHSQGLGDDFTAGATIQR